MSSSVRTWCLILPHNGNGRQISEPLGIIHSIPNDEYIGNLKAHISSSYLPDSSRRFTQKGADIQRLRTTCPETTSQILQRQTGIKDIFYYQDFSPLNRRVQIFNNSDLA